jgi:hypothetical protein
MRYIISLLNIIAFEGKYRCCAAKCGCTFCMKVCVHLALKWFYTPAGADDGFMNLCEECQETFSQV